MHLYQNMKIINLNNSKLESQSWISKETIEKDKIFILKKKDQVLFFLNRRGFSPHVLCKNVLLVIHVQIVQ